MSFKRRLKRLRKRTGMTQEALAVAAGLSLAAVRKWEQKDVGDPSLATAKKLAKALGVTLDELAGR